MWGESFLQLKPGLPLFVFSWVLLFASMNILPKLGLFRCTCTCTLLYWLHPLFLSMWFASKKKTWHALFYGGRGFLSLGFSMCTVICFPGTEPMARLGIRSCNYYLQPYCLGLFLRLLCCVTGV